MNLTSRCHTICRLAGWLLPSVLALGSAAQAAPSPSITVNAAEVKDPLPVEIYSQFIEHLGRCIYGGIWAEILEDRKFYYPIAAKYAPYTALEESPFPVIGASPWEIVGPAENVRMRPDKPFVGRHTPEIKAAAIRQHDLGITQGKQYVGYAWIKSADDGPARAEVSLVWGEGPNERQTVNLGEAGDEYGKTPFRFTAGATTDRASLEFRVRDGAVLLGTISLMPADNVEGMRADTLALLKELKAPIYRWPGGNFVSGYDWRDGIGQRDRRPPRANPAWTGVEHNDFGIHEFVRFCRLVGAEPWITVNTGFGDAYSAAAEVEYANGGPDTYWGAKRAGHGAPDPYNVKYWGIGNEMYGEWQLGHMALNHYVLKQNWVVDKMREVDPKVICAASGNAGPWSRGLLERCANHMDYIAEHFYCGELPDLAEHVRQIPDSIRAKAEFHRKMRRELLHLEDKDIRVAMTEWNYWYGPQVFGQIGPRYFLKDALGVAAGLHEYARNTDIVASAFYAQTVNVIGCIKTSRRNAAFETTGLVLKLYRHHFGQIPVATETTGPLDAQAAWTTDRKTLTLGVVNVSLEAMEATLTVAGARLTGAGQSWQIAAADPRAFNDPDEAPDRVKIESKPLTDVQDPIRFAPCSVTLLALEAEPSLAVRDLRCEYRVNPVGMDVVRPRLSWTLASDQRGQKQTAYHILVATSADLLARNEGDLWDTGKVNSNQTVHVVYDGQPLRSRMRAWWKVRVWDKDGRPSAWSDAATWTIGLLEASDWHATWIADPDSVLMTLKAGDASSALPATMVRKSFQLNDTVKRATVYVTACGLYELRLNGQRVGDKLLAPEWTSYRKRIQYQTFDVTELLRSGENVLAASLGEGWYAGRLMVVGRNAYGSYPRFLLQLEIELADGRKQLIVTDDSWRSTTDGPIRSSGIYDGEVYDARKDQAGWDAPGFDDSHWNQVRAFGLGDAQLVWQRNEAIRVVRELQPISLAEPKPGVYVFDLGQNMVGWCRIHVRGSAGQTITIRHAEMLNDDGTLYTANLRGAQQTDRYIPCVDGEVSFEPHFTYHGFRFVELTGLAEPPAKSAVLGRIFHSRSPDAGRFECSDSSLNQLMRNIVWTQRGNLMSTPNDCPQRDERFGWMGDIQAFSQTAIFNMDLAAFMTKFAQDIRDDQADDGRYPDFAPHPGNPNSSFSGVPAWGDAGTIVPWRAFQNYADTRLLEQHFESARRWVDYIRGQNPDLIWAKARHNDYNDWLNGDWIRQQDWPTQGGAVPKEVFATAFFAHSTQIVANMAHEIGRQDDARRYGELFEQIKAAFNQKFVEPDGCIEGDTQAGYALALNFNLLPDDLQGKAAQYLVDNIRRYQGHLSTGIQTTHRAMLELTRHGHTDVAWQLLTNRTFPSWLYMIDNGATTIWERWDGYVKGRGFQDPGMNSFNHWALGAVGEWMWRHIAGLNPDDTHPGWQHFVIAPRPGGGVTWAKGEYQSIRGPIVSDWKIENGMITLAVVVPPNTTATVYVPAKDAAAVKESGMPANQADGVKFLRAEVGAAVFEVGSGTYVFKASVS